MPLVYVHGIGNRSGDRYESAARARDALFRRLFVPVVFPARLNTTVSAPYWGEHGATPRWQLASLPTGGIEALGAADDEAALIAESLAAPGTDSHAALLGLARTSMADAIDALFTLADPQVLPELAGFADETVRFRDFREQLYPGDPEPIRYPWLAEVTDDTGFLDRLVAEVQGFATKPVGSAAGAPVETLGVGAMIRDLLATGLRALRRATIGPTAGTSVGLTRRLFGRNLAVLVGDVLAYLAQRGTPGDPGPVVRVIGRAIEDAVRLRRPDDPVVVIAHSMGGNIVYDLLTHFRTDLKVDVLVTVGSQVGLFEELKLFGASRPEIPNPSAARVPMPAAASCWLNVVDQADPFAFRAAPVFDGATDYQYPSAALWAHTAYLRQPSFHARVARRVAAALP